MDDTQTLLYKDCISKQLVEVDLLSSIYCNPGEMHIYDAGVISDFNDYLKGNITVLPAHLDFAITITTGSGDKIKIRIELPHLYPAIENAIVTIHSTLLSKSQGTSVKANIENYIASLEKSDTYIFQVISWLQEEIDGFLANDTADLVQEKDANQPEIVDFARLWIYSHHIKSKIKRKEIVRLSHELNLSGFLRPGKPGIICVEGLLENTQEFWRVVKAMQWQKITLRANEIKQKSYDKLSALRRFDGFRELLFTESGDETGAKITMSQFMAFLEEHNSGYIKKELFGFE